MRATKTWKTWTVKESDRLETLRLAGKTVREIAAELGRTRPSVVCQLARLRLRKPSQRREAWHTVLSRPHTTASAAAALGVKPGTVKAIKYRLRQAGFAVLATEKIQPHRGICEPITD